MSLISENIIPGAYGKTFVTNAKEHRNLEKIKKEILKVKGIKDVVVNEKVFPKQLEIHSKILVSVKKIEKAVISAGFHAIPKTYLSF